jgi:hypothetical protein
MTLKYAFSALQNGQELVDRIKANGGSAKAVRADISKPAEARQLIDATLAEFLYYASCDRSTCALRSRRALRDIRS